MRKINLVLGLGVAALVLFFSSCGETSEYPAPTISISSDNPVVLEAGEDSTTITGTIVAEAGLDNVTVIKMTGLSEQQIGSYSSFESGPFTTTDDENYSISLTITDIEEDITIKIEARDKEDQYASQSVEIEAASIGEFSVVLMGAQNNADHGSTASLTTGEVFPISGGVAATNSALVDIVYYYGSRLAALYSPSQADIQGVSLYNIPGWGTINETMLGESSLSASAFDDVSSVSDIEGAGTPTLDVVPELSVDDVIVFETDSGKKGVFKVTELNTGDSGTITISVKVEL
jgi:hypothetical protein